MDGNTTKIRNPVRKDNHAHLNCNRKLERSRSLPLITVISLIMALMKRQTDT